VPSDSDKGLQRAQKALRRRLSNMSVNVTPLQGNSTRNTAGPMSLADELDDEILF
jgi:hypothetical protein